MKLPLCLLFVTSVTLSHLQAADHVPSDKPLSAFETLKLARKQLGESGKYLLKMESEHAKLRPRYWWIRFFDEKALLKTRAIQIIGPEIIQNVVPSNPFDGGNMEHAIQSDQLKYDSEKCISFIEKAAKENHIPLHSLKVRLEKPYPGESNPIWYFEWFDEKDHSLGEVDISATTGKVIEIIGLKIKDKKFQSVSKNTFSQNVEETFVGIGNDLEDFFTDKHAADQPESSENKSKDQKPE